ncbi:hypothetical protein TWF281_002377 [Arthrobotrys megalospora]
MAVCFAATQSRKIGRLFSGEEIRSWIRQGRSDRSGELISKFQSAKDAADYEEAAKQHQQLEWDPLDITPSVTSVIALSATSILLSSAVFTFLTGIGIYLGFLYGKKLNMSSGDNDNRNVLIVYLIGLGSCIAVYSVASNFAAKATDLKSLSMLREFRDNEKLRLDMLQDEDSAAAKRVGQN